jgi:alpha-tubulin suppressor-like RCC1 family protein
MRLIIEKKSPIIHQVYVWGDNTGGKLGLGHRERQDLPGLVVALQEETVVRVAAGLDYCLALTSRLAAAAWGFSEDECLAVTTSDPVVNYPEPVHALPRLVDSVLE